ncbi:MAG: orange carotenoid protein N-terminal domain-containing protein [Cyanobacteriota bacterium]|nr:orange carotenoid protein N-terminal domain-containing protein [Cyanobacteriota bacterium]
MTAAQTNDPKVREIVQSIQKLDVDEQLALFYFIYKEMGDSITPAAPGASTVSPAVADGLFNQVKELSQEEQLQLQRDLINKADTVHTREYGGMSDTTKLLFWYRLAQGMDAHTIIPMPSNYEISSQSKEIIEKIKPLDFGVQMSLFRDYVAPMGSEPKSGSAV